MELVVVAQLAAMGKKQTLQDIVILARQAGRPDIADQLKKPLADAEAQLPEVDARVKEILALTVPETGKIEALLKIEESYGKLLGGLRMERAARETQSKQVEKIVQTVKDDIAKAQH